MTRRVPFHLLAGILVFGCGQTGYGGTGQAPPTAVVVDPAEFLGDVVCDDSPGGMKRYVATLVDVLDTPEISADAAAFALPSSAPTECYRAVHFLRIAMFREYVADIDGYDRADIRPVAPGSRLMQVDVEGGDYVPPRWTTSCGREASLLPAPGPDAGDGGSDGGPSVTDAAGAPPEEAGVEAGRESNGCRQRPTDGGRPTFPWPACSLPNTTVTVKGCGPLTTRGDAGP